MKITPELLVECRDRFTRGELPDAIIEYLRHCGLSKIETIKVFVDLGLATPTEAKRIIHLSPVWQDAFERDERLHSRLEKHVRDTDEI